MSEKTVTSPLGWEGAYRTGGEEERREVVRGGEARETETQRHKVGRRDRPKGGRLNLLRRGRTRIKSRFPC